MMKRNTQRLQQLINELLELSKLETGRMKLVVSAGDLSGYLRTLASSFISLAEKRGIQYKIDIKEEPGQYFFDKDKVEKILTNLISNALKFTPEEGFVNVVLNYISSPENGSMKNAQIIISDTGPGIPADEMDKIFDRFHQVDSHEGRYAEGTGIGLALVKELLDLYRGRIEVDSEIGTGSKFIVILPVSREQFSKDEFKTLRDESEEDAETDSNQGGDESIMADRFQYGSSKTEFDNPVILIVEDNDDLRKYISQGLDIQYQILEAENGKQGFIQATESIPDLVISDLMMPEMDGNELCEQLRSDYRTSHIPFIMLTAKADKESKLDSYEKGADDYILKPFDAEELRSRVRNLIEQRKRLREKYRKELINETGPIVDTPRISDEFLIKVSGLIDSNMTNSEYNVEQLGQDVGLSQSQLYRKLMALTDHSPVEFIRNLRLRAAAEMFRKGQKNVSTVLYSVGFNTPSHFSRYFRELYGINPSEYVSKIRNISD
jgi:DNA-binding response OmpR family regulator/two-component sensor histidine kinase